MMLVWPELKNWDGTQIDEQILSDRSGGILSSWVLRTYYQLRLVGEAVTLSGELRPDSINVVSVRDFGRKQRALGSFIVVPQADAHHSQLANFRIMQNGVCPIDNASAVIWHWTQPGIIARDPSRGDRIQQLCYKGRVLNLDEGFHSEGFIAALSNKGITFELDAYTGEHGEHSWNDYYNSDIVIAVRNLTSYDASKKPASKLVNAWFADLPAILGPEPAFRELGTSGKDYLEITTPRDALNAVSALQTNPGLFRSIIQNGRQRREHYTEAALTALWIETLNGPISEHFTRWHKTPLWKRAYHSMMGIMREPRARAHDKVGVRTGTRILDATPVQEALK